MRIGNGPRLVVPRAGITRRPWGWYGRKSPGQQYDEHRERERARLRRMTYETAGDVKTPAVWLSYLKPGEYFRLVDGHGRTYGPRHWNPVANVPHNARVRRVARQEEDLHSQISRILKRAHKLAMRED